MKSVNIVIFGLSLRALNDLKQTIIHILPPDIDLNWSNIAAPQLDVLMINEAFYDVPSIQHLLNNQKLKVLKLVTNLEKHSTIEGNILYLPIQQPTALKDWLFKEVVGQTDLSYTELLASESRTTTSKAEHQVVQKKQQKSVQEVLFEIQHPRNGKMQIFDAHGMIGLVDPRGQWAWSNPTRQRLASDHSLNYTYATTNDSAAFSQVAPEDMKSWLWNLLWHSPAFALLASQPSSFLLEFWPQPHAGADRRDILRMSACFVQGAKISQVAQHLEISEDRVRQFVAASLSVGFGKVIADGEAKYHPHLQVGQEQTGFMRKLFGGLRRRLGF